MASFITSWRKNSGLVGTFLFQIFGLNTLFLCFSLIQFPLPFLKFLAWLGLRENLKANKLLCDNLLSVPLNDVILSEAKMPSFDTLQPGQLHIC